MQDKNQDLESKKQEIRKHLEKELLPTLKVEIRALGEAEAGLSRANELESQYKSQIEKLEVEVSSLREKIKETLGDGQDPAKLLTELRSKADHIEALKSWLEGSGAAAAGKDQVKAARESLKQRVHLGLNSIKPQYQAKVDALAVELMNMIRAWTETAREFSYEISRTPFDHVGLHIREVFLADHILPR